MIFLLTALKLCLLLHSIPDTVVGSRSQRYHVKGYHSPRALKEKDKKEDDKKEDDKKEDDKKKKECVKGCCGIPDDEGTPDDIEHMQSVTNSLIFGTGVNNGGFSTVRRNGVELGLRIKERCPTPSNTFYTDGGGVFFVPAGNAAAALGTGWLCGQEDTPKWSFEWAVNVNYDNSNEEGLDDDDTGAVIGCLQYELGFDTDPTTATNYNVFADLIPSEECGDLDTVPDHAFGDNGTTQSGGFVAADADTYQEYVETYNIAQQSWNTFFFTGSPFTDEPLNWNVLDPDATGVYDMYLAAYCGKNEIARTSITIVAQESCSP